jgi:hypothetical protein
MAPARPLGHPRAARVRRTGQVVPRAIAVADVRGLLLLNFVCGQERRGIGGHPNAVDPHGRVPGPLQRVGDDHLEHLQSPVARQNTSPRRRSWTRSSKRALKLLRTPHGLPG